MIQDHPIISAILVNYNTREMTVRCLESVVADLAGIPSEIIVVDNGSSDGSAEFIAGAAPYAKLIISEKNAGFGAGNNLAMREARGDYFLLINTDAFPKPGASAALLQYLQGNPKVGVVGPKLLNADGSNQQSCFRFPTPLRSWMENLWISAAMKRYPAIDDYRFWGHDSQRMVDFVIGACLLVRRSVYEQVGGFDEKFFMYAEESDWMYRMQKAGWQTAFIPTAFVTHLGGASGAADRPKINKFFFESLDYYELKHHGMLGLLSLRAAMAIGCSIRAALWTAVMFVSKRRRELARSKAKLLAWLVFRQSTYWRLPSRHV
ncbi:MAG: glycosyltransferase family 2 protein [Planctomycetota bacterium]|nr:glycosyltransferase family 2 protein [Planctomycetota bacterium]